MQKGHLSLFVPGAYFIYSFFPLQVLKRATLTTWEGLLGEEFTGDVANSWQNLLDYVVAVMVEGNRVYVEEERRCTLVTTPEVDEVEERLNVRADVKLHD